MELLDCGLQLKTVQKKLLSVKYLDFENEKTVKTSHALKTVEEDSQTVL